MTLYQLEQQWKQFIDNLKARPHTNGHTASESHYFDSGNSANNPEERHRLSLNEIKDRLEEWDRQR